MHVCGSGGCSAPASPATAAGLRTCGRPHCCTAACTRCSGCHPARHRHTAGQGAGGVEARAGAHRGPCRAASPCWAPRRRRESRPVPAAAWDRHLRPVPGLNPPHAAPRASPAGAAAGLGGAAAPADRTPSSRCQTCCDRNVAATQRIVGGCRALCTPGAARRLVQQCQSNSAVSADPRAAPVQDVLLKPRVQLRQNQLLRAFLANGPFWLLGPFPLRARAGQQSQTVLFSRQGQPSHRPAVLHVSAARPPGWRQSQASARHSGAGAVMHVAAGAGCPRQQAGRSH